jgi:hypothetical protein
MTMTQERLSGVAILSLFTYLFVVVLMTVEVVQTIQ